jgi:hypothetical protein
MESNREPDVQGQYSDRLVHTITLVPAMRLGQLKTFSIIHRDMSRSHQFDTPIACLSSARVDITMDED